MKNKNASRVHDKVCVLFSGGMDSSTCIAFYKKQDMGVTALFIDYNQPALKYELQSAKKISKHFKVDLNCIEIAGLKKVRSGFVPGRNGIFATIAMSFVSFDTGLLAMGIHSGVSYPDCKPGFVDACQRMADVYHEGRLRIVAPFISWNKLQVFELAKKLSVPLEDTYSCEMGMVNGCGRCASCLDRARIMI